MSAPPPRPPLIHNMWIMFEKRSQGVERTCLVSWDRPYTPSLDGGPLRRPSRQAAKSASSPARTEAPLRRLRALQTADASAPFHGEYPTERKVERFPKNLWTPETTGTRYRDPAAGSPPLPSVLEN